MIRGKLTMESYATRDSYLASYLIEEGENYADVHLANHNSTEFLFEKSKELRGLVENFYTKKALVNPMSYGNTLRSVKSIIHSLKSGYVTSTLTQGIIMLVLRERRASVWMRSMRSKMVLISTKGFELYNWGGTKVVYDKFSNTVRIG